MCRRKQIGRFGWKSNGGGQDDFFQFHLLYQCLLLLLLLMMMCQDISCQQVSTQGMSHSPNGLVWRDFFLQQSMQWLGEEIHRFGRSKPRIAPIGSAGGQASNGSATVRTLRTAHAQPIDQQDASDLATLQEWINVAKKESKTTSLIHQQA